MPSGKFDSAQTAGIRAAVRPDPVQVIAVTGGKGGVGKTSVAVNLAAALASQGKRVLLFDGDLESSAPQVIGLIDVGALRAENVDTIATSQGETTHLAPRLQAARTGLASTLQGGDREESPEKLAASGNFETSEDGNARHRPGLDRRSHTASRAPSLSSSLAAKAALPGG